MTDNGFREVEFIIRNETRIRQDTGEPTPQELTEDDQAFRAWKKKEVRFNRQKLKEQGRK